MLTTNLELIGVKFDLTKIPNSKVKKVNFSENLNYKPICFYTVLYNILSVIKYIYPAKDIQLINMDTIF